MFNVQMPTNSLFVDRPQLKKSEIAVTNPAQDLKMLIKNPQEALPKLVVPGFNDHHVILFSGKKGLKGLKKPSFTGQYKPVDNVEANNMDLFKNVSPSVVQLKVKSLQVMVNPQTGEEKEVIREGSGSGSIIDKEGHVLTNFHVINQADEIKVVLDKDREVSGKVIGSDASTDLAVVKLDMPAAELAKLPVMKLGSSEEAQGGQRVLAMGNPFNLYRTVTEGMVSAVGRSIVSPGGRLTKDVIQTDAPINPGNSGGALVNAKGEQIGINAQIYSPSGASAGLGFAIPIDLAKKVVAELKANGIVNRPFIGLSGGIPLEAMHPQIKHLLGIGKMEQGVILQEVIPGSPSAKAGLTGGSIMVSTNTGDSIVLGGDIITRVNGKPVGNMTEIFEILDEHKAGEKLTVDYVSMNIEPDEKTGMKGTPSEPKSTMITIGDTPRPRPDKPLSMDMDNKNALKPLEHDNLDRFWH